MSHVERLAELRFHRPDAVAEALASRRPGTLPTDGRRALFVAADHPGRGALAAGGDALAMADREDYLARCTTALSRPGVTGFLGTPDLVEDLALLGALDGKVVLGSMNRSGLAGSNFEVDDRITAYDPDGIVAAGIDGGKLLLRIDLDDPRTPSVLERAGRAVSQLAAAGRSAVIEPFLSYPSPEGLVNDLSEEAVIRSVTIASALGNTSARTWLKIPCTADLERAVAATSLPCLLLGGEVPKDPEQTLSMWRSAMRLPNVHGLVLGRSLLFPRDGDVAANVDRIVEVL